jgi:type I restriction enzyme, S subunit
MNTYPSYKESGVEWIGEIPSGWKYVLMKYYFDYTKGSEGQKLTSSYIENHSGVHPVYSGKTGGDGVLGYIDEYEFDYPFPLIFTTTVGAKSMTTKLLEGKFSLSQNCLVMIKKVNCNPSFVQYFLSYDFIYEKELLPIILQPSLRMEDLDQYKILIPSLQEQQQISDYLDYKTSKIDSLIEKTKQKMELLKEQRTSLINIAVTKGLNPDVEMKDSGVEWIGEIPSGWDIMKGKYILIILTGHSPDELVEDKDGVPFIKVVDLNHTVDGYFLEDTNMSVQPDSKTPLEKNILLFPKRGMAIFTNKIVISKIEGFIDPNLMGVKVFENTNMKFVFNVLKSRGLADICDLSTIPQINNKHIYPLQFPFPPLQEQQQIVEYLDKETSIIDTLIAKESKRIDLLKEYRQSLISNVVTGKVDVRNEVLA